MKWKWFLSGVAFAAALTVGVWAQPIVQNQVSGLEVWNCGQGPGGVTTSFCQMNVTSSRRAQATFATITGNFTIGTATGNFTQAVGAVTPVNLTAGGNMLVTAQPSAAVITMPPNPVPDGAIIGYCNVTGAPFATAAVTFAANTNQTLNTAVTVTTQAATSCALVQWNQVNATWYRVQ